MRRRSASGEAATTAESKVDVQLALTTQRADSTRSPPEQGDDWDGKRASSLTRMSGQHTSGWYYVH